MSNPALPHIIENERISQFPLLAFQAAMNHRPHLAQSITKAASRQTYYVVQFLVDRQRREDAFRAYAYFRWLDDYLDQPSISQHERQLFLNRQESLVQRAYQDLPTFDVTPEEQLLIDLVSTDLSQCGGLHAYVTNMMKVMAFDTERGGKVVSSSALDCYSWNLAIAVTEALHYFIGHDTYSPHTSTRYLAACGAHIIHMLRDTVEDNSMGYFNIPGEYLEMHRLDPNDTDNKAYREWVRQRIDLAKSYFQLGKEYLATITSIRCRFAALTYMARFEAVLDKIEQDNYVLRSNYKDCLSWSSMLKHSWSVLPMLFN
jgi:phytoene/squalene synthetase